MNRKEIRDLGLKGRSAENNYPINLYWVDDLLRSMNERNEVICVDDVLWMFQHIMTPDDEYKEFFNELVSTRNQSVKVGT